MRLHKYLNNKGFTLMELLITVILVAVLASYSVYYYNNTIDEGKLHAAKGKMATLGGALERFKMENDRHIGCSESKVDITASNIMGACDLSDHEDRLGLLNVFRCGYAEKSLALDENFDFAFACPSECGVETTINEFVVIMTPKNASQSPIFPSCVYFDPVHDKAVEVE